MTSAESIETTTTHTGPTPAADARLRADARAVEVLVKRAGTSFYWAMKLMPPERRAGLFAVYAFCRAVDDVVDESASEDKDRLLDEWRQEVARVHDGVPTTAIGRELALAVARFEVRRSDFEDVIDGMAMDAGAPIRAPSLAELDLYCGRVASAVGRLCIRIFGAPHDAGDRLAEHLGRALQLTNILRDVAEDAAMGRLYLPLELLEAEGIHERDPAAVARHPALPRVCARVGAMARGRFALAEEAMAQCPPATVRPARIMQAVYLRILDRLEARGWPVDGERVSLTKLERVFIGLRHAWF